MRVGVLENARRLLELGEALRSSPRRARGDLGRFADRTGSPTSASGFMRLALETETPVVPIAVIGAEEQYVSLGNADMLAKALGWPSFPVIPQGKPCAGAGLPTAKYRTIFGEADVLRG